MTEPDSRARCTRAGRFLQGLFGLEGRVVLVTGGRVGIGAELAGAFAWVGASVAITSRSLPGAEQAASAIDQGETAVVPVALDLEKTEDIEASVAYVIRRLGRLDVLVNNAAQTAGSASLEIGQAEWQTVVQANLTGTFFMAQAAAREMSKRGGGRIINLSSTYAKSAVAARAPYAASKAGVEALTRSLALEWADYGINVNAIAPTTIATPGRAEMLSDERFVARRRSEIPLGRIGVPADLVATALLLAGPGGEFITGETIVVDGGFTLR